MGLGSLTALATMAIGATVSVSGHGGPDVEKGNRRVVENLSAWPAWYLAMMALFGLLLIGLAAYDVRHRRLPNSIVYPAIAVALGLAFAQPVGPWWGYVGTGALVGLALGLLAVVSGGFGFGDVKLGALIGLLLGWPSILVGLFVAFASGAVVGVVLIASGRIRREQPLPFAPALVGGAVVGFLAGPGILRLLWPGLFRP